MSESRRTERPHTILASRNKSRAINAKPGISAPKIGRVQESFSNRYRVQSTIRRWGIRVWQRPLHPFQAPHISVPRTVIHSVTTSLEPIDRYPRSGLLQVRSAINKSAWCANHMGGWSQCAMDLGSAFLPEHIRHIRNPRSAPRPSRP